MSEVGCTWLRPVLQEDEIAGMPGFMVYLNSSWSRAGDRRLVLGEPWGLSADITDVTESLVFIYEGPPYKPDSTSITLLPCPLRYTLR